MFGIVGLVAGLAWAECASAIDEGTLTANLDAAERSFAALDADAFGAAMDDVVYQVPCFDAVAPPPLAARVHRLLGLRWFISGADDDALGAFKAAVAADPAYSFPETLVPPGHAVRDSYTRAVAEPAESMALPEPKAVTVYIDGAVATERGAGVPAWVQLSEAEAVVHSSYLLTADPMPAYDAKPLPEPGARDPVGLLVGAGAGLVASGILYAAASASAASFDSEHPDYDLDALRAHRARTNSLVGGSIAAAGGAAAFGVTFVLVK